MTKLNNAFVSIICTTLLLSACSQAPDEYESANMSSAETSEEVAAETSNEQSSDGYESDSAGVSESSQSTIKSDTKMSHHLTTGSSATQNKKPLQVTMQADFNVNDVVNVVANIEQLTQKYQGYVALSQIENNESYPTKRVNGDIVTTITPYQRYANMELHIPRRNVANFLKDMQANITFLKSSHFTAIDKTFDIYLQQLEVAINKEVAEELKQQRLNPADTNSEDQSKNQSSNVDSIEATYESKHRQALAEVERMRLKDSVEYSVLTLNFMQPRDVYQTQTKNIDAIIEAAEPSFGSQLADSLKEGLEGLKIFTLWFASIWWFWVLLVISVPVLKTLWRFWGRKKFFTSGRDEDSQLDDNIDDKK